MSEAGLLASRRAFLGSCALACAGACALSLGLVPAARARAHWAPRPPGAVDEADFSALCARCGRCVTACPYGTLKLADLTGPVAQGTPYFEARLTPCEMCEDLPCVKACPTGALSPELKDVKKARMGVAVVDPGSCLSFQGLRCEVCLRECPVAGKAITIEMQPRGLSKHAFFLPVVHADACTGCGLCEKGCPTDVPAIRVQDRKAFLGQIGEHYRLGWLPESDPKNRREHHEASPGEFAPEAPSGLDYLNGDDL